MIMQKTQFLPHLFCSLLMGLESSTLSFQAILSGSVGALLISTTVYVSMQWDIRSGFARARVPSTIRLAEIAHSRDKGSLKEKSDSSDGL